MSLRPYSHPLRPAALASLLTLGLITPWTAHAQVGAPSAIEQRYPLNIPSKALGAALNELARQAQLQLLVNQDLVQGKQSPAVVGSLTAGQALQRLLEGSGLVAQIDGTTVVVRPAPVDTLEPRASDIPVVRVTAQADRGVVPFVAAENTSLGFGLPAHKTPAVINTVTEEFWTSTASKTLDEVLSFVPGINLTDNGGWTGDTVSIRGFPSTIPFRDGLRQVDSGYGQSLRAMPDNTERIEVVKGPAGAEFGVAEPGGAVNFVSKRPLRDPVRTVSLSIGEDGYRKASADLTGPLTADGGLQGRLVLAYAEPEEWRSGRPDDTYRYLIAPTVNWDYGPEGRLTLAYERIHQNSPQDRGIIYLEGAWAGGFAPRDWSFHQTSSQQTNQTDRLRLDHEHQLSDSLTWHTALEHGTYRYRLQEFRNAESEPGWGNLYEDDGLTWTGERLINLFWDNWRGDTRASALRTTLEYQLRHGAAEHTLTAGFDWFSSTNDAESLYSNVANTFDILAPDNSQAPQFIDKDYARWTSTIRVREKGLSAKWLAQWTPRLRTIVGLRSFDYQYDYDAAYVDYLDPNNNYPYADAYGSRRTSLRIAGSFDLTPEHTVFAGVSDGFVPQTGIRRDGSPLKPIHDQAVEVGVKSRLLGGKLAWTNSAYAIRRADASLQDPSNGPNDSFVVNGGKADVSGVESELMAELWKHLRVRGGLALQKSRIVANDTAAFVGNRFANTPTHQVSLLLSQNWSAAGWPELTTDLGMVRIGQRWGNSGNTISLPAYNLLSLGAAYRLGRQTTARLSVANATDETYYTGMQDSGARADQVMVGAKRNAFLTLQHDF